MLTRCAVLLHRGSLPELTGCSESLPDDANALRLGTIWVTRMAKVRDDIESFAGGFGDRAPQAARQALEMCEHGEWGIGFEDLLSNLHEADLLLSDTELDKAEAITAALGQSVMQVEALRGLATDADGRRQAVVFTLAHMETVESLHDVLARAFDFPGFHGRNWDAFWDSITGLVQMPHVVQIWGWDVFSARLPRHASQFLRLMLDAQQQYPQTASAVLLYGPGDISIDASAELRRLSATGQP